MGSKNILIKSVRFSGKKLKRLRERRKISQEKFAAAVGMTQKAISHLENEHQQEPRAINLFAMSQVLRVPMEELFAPIDPIDGVCSDSD